MVPGAALSSGRGCGRAEGEVRPKFKPLKNCSLDEQNFSEKKIKDLIQAAADATVRPALAWLCGRLLPAVSNRSLTSCPRRTLNRDCPQSQPPARGAEGPGRAAGGGGPSC